MQLVSPKTTIQVIKLLQLLGQSQYIVHSQLFEIKARVLRHNAESSICKQRSILSILKTYLDQTLQMFLDFSVMALDAEEWLFDRHVEIRKLIKIGLR